MMIKRGAIAQLVERLNGIEEVSGSNPLSSIGCDDRFERSDSDVDPPDIQSIFYG